MGLGRLLRLKRAPTSDSEYIERIRGNLAFHERWKWWLGGLYGIAAAASLYMPVFFAQLMIGLGGNQALPMFTVAVGMGLALGFFIFHSFGGLFVHLIVPFRTERLLLQYHDALAELVQEMHKPTPEADGGI